MNLDLEGPLEPAGEESSEWTHDGGEAGQSDAVDLEWVKLHRGLEQTENTHTPLHQNYENIFMNH